MDYVCRDCLVDFQVTKPKTTPGDCEWCKKPSHDVKYIRDYDEGLYGREYCVCVSCRINYAERVQKEAMEDNPYGHDIGAELEEFMAD